MGVPDARWREMVFYSEDAGGGLPAPVRTFDWIGLENFRLPFTDEYPI